VNPLDGTVFLDTASAFVTASLHLLAGEGVWGRGRYLSPEFLQGHAKTVAEQSRNEKLASLEPLTLTLRLRDTRKFVEGGSRTWNRC
jgi:hypothetical protein